MDEAQLLNAVDSAFAATSAGIERWADPHGAESPKAEEYSRVTDAERWRIIGARADAWVAALVESGLATVNRGVEVAWRDEPGPIITRTDLVTPSAPGALPIVIGRSSIVGGDNVRVDDVGVVLGVGAPAVCIARLPDCGCDACDSGSQNELDKLDEMLCSVTSGAFRHLTKRDRVITQTGPGAWSYSGSVRYGRVDRILARPKGWVELSGASWLTA